MSKIFSRKKDMHAVLHFLYEKCIFLLQKNVFMLNLSTLFFYVKKAWGPSGYE